MLIRIERELTAHPARVRISVMVLPSLSVIRELRFDANPQRIGAHFFSQCNTCVLRIAGV